VKKQDRSTLEYGIKALYKNNITLLFIVLQTNYDTYSYIHAVAFRLVFRVATSGSNWAGYYCSTI